MNSTRAWQEEGDRLRLFICDRKKGEEGGLNVWLERFVLPWQPRSHGL